MASGAPYSYGSAGTPIMQLRDAAAQQVQLTLPAVEQLAPQSEKWLQLGIVLRRNRRAARLVGDKGGQSEKVLALRGERLGTLGLAAAPVDPPFEIQRAGEPRLKYRVARRHPLHAGSGIAVTVGAGSLGDFGLGRPQSLSLQYPQHSGIGRVVLHRPGFQAGEVVARAPVYGPDLRSRSCRRSGGDHSGYQDPHSTVICLTSVCVLPRSSVQLKTISPLSVATVTKAMNGFAAIAGNSSARNTSSPL
jgi:hypothetical protein